MSLRDRAGMRMLRAFVENAMLLLFRERYEGLYALARVLRSTLEFYKTVVWVYGCGYSVILRVCTLYCFIMHLYL